MDSSRRGEMVVKVGTWRDLTPATWLCALCRDWKKVVVEGVELAMVDRGHLIQECRCARLLHGWNIRGRGGARPSSEGEDPDENWFCMENSSKETRALMHVEGELNATLLFEHGSGQPTITLWVACILLS